MELHDLMKIYSSARVIALMGGGGKTGCMLALAREAAAAGHRAAVLTTTHILSPQGPGVFLLTANDPAAAEYAWQKGLAVAAGTPGPDGRLQRPEQGLWDLLLREADRVYVEADGSKGLPLKYPAVWEPALPPEAEQALLLCGLSALGQPPEQCCHRWELAEKELGLCRRPVDEELMARVLTAGYGAYHPTVIINQADSEELARRGRELSRLLAERGIEQSAVISLRNYLARQNPAAAGRGEA